MARKKSSSGKRTPSERPESCPRGYEWLPDAYQRDVEPHGPAAREKVRQTLAEGDIKAILQDRIGERYTIPPRMWRKEPLAQMVYPQFQEGWCRVAWPSHPHYVEGWIFIPEGALKKALQEEPSAGQSADQALPDPYHTGLPGRPTIKHLIEQELLQRIEKNQILPSLSEEACALRDWAAVRHPTVRTPTEKTIKNNIRKLYRPPARNSAQN